MMRPTDPARVIQHSVKNGQLVSTSDALSVVCFAVSPTCVGILRLSSVLEGKLDCSELFFLEDCVHEEISFIRAHPDKDFLCVGTTQHGVYSTKLSAPVLDHSTRLPLSVSGEMVHCGCFVSLHPLNILAFSSSFVNRKGQSPHRLTLWDLDHDCLLWRGGTELLVSMCTFTGEAAFAACTEDKISLFSVQQTDGTGDGKPKVVVLSRGCGFVDELQDSKYVECLCPKTAGDTFTVLTSLGYLVSHDKQSGAVVRWMNCKVSPVVSANFVDDFVVLAGSLTRFFKQDSWEFSGKIKLNVGVERPSDTLTNVFSAVVGCGGNSYLIFTANGEMGLYSAVIDKTPTKVQFKRHYLHTPVTSCDGIVDWYFPANTTDGSWALFTSTQLTLFDHTLCTKRLIPHFATSSAFISEHNIVVCFLADTNELVAYNTLAGWGEWARVKLRSPVVSIASSPSSQLACLHDDGYKISYFTVRCEVLGGGTQSFVFEPLEGSTHLGEPLLQLVCAEDNNFYGVGSKQVYHLANENVLNLKGKVVCVSKLGADLLICQETGCVRYKTLTQECVVVSSSKGIQSMSVHPKRPVVALAMRTEITIYELFSDVKPRIVETIFYSMSNAPSGGEPFTTIQSVAWEDDNRLLVLDASGGLSEYTLENVRFSQGKPPTRDQRLAPPEKNNLKLERRQRRSASANIPSSRDLELRFGVLADFYETQRKMEAEATPRVARQRGRGAAEGAGYDGKRTCDLSPGSAVEVSELTCVNDASAFSKGAADDVNARPPAEEGEAQGNHSIQTNTSEISTQTRFLKRSLENFRSMLENEAYEELTEDNSIGEIGELASLMADVALSLQRKLASLSTVSSAAADPFQRDL